MERRRHNPPVEPDLTEPALFIDDGKALVFTVHEIIFIGKQGEFIHVRRPAPGTEGTAVSALVAHSIDVENLPLQMARNFNGYVGSIGTDFGTDLTDAVTVETTSITAGRRRRR